jgi:hypothetical protein
MLLSGMRHKLRVRERDYWELREGHHGNVCVLKMKKSNQ